MKKEQLLENFWRIYNINGAMDAIKWLQIVKYDVYEEYKNNKDDLDDITNIIEQLSI